MRSERGLGQVLQGSTAFCTSTQQCYSVVQLKIAKAICDWLLFSLFFCLLPFLPASVLEFLIRCSFSSQPLSCNGPTFKGLVPTCLAPQYLIIMHLLMSHSRKLAHSSDDASTAQISPSARCVQPP